jgi:hypothetical protein
MRTGSKKVRMLTGMSMLGLTGGMLGMAAAPAGAAVATPHAEGAVTTPATGHVHPMDDSVCYFKVINNPTPVYYYNFEFDKYKHTGSIVTGPIPDSVYDSSNGVIYQGVYLGGGGMGWMDQGKLEFLYC